MSEPMIKNRLMKIELRKNAFEILNWHEKRTETRNDKLKTINHENKIFREMNREKMCQKSLNLGYLSLLFLYWISAASGQSCIINR